jgi:hypothetical protein
MRNALPWVIVLGLACGLACAPRAKTYTGMVLTGLGGLAALGGVTALASCTEDQGLRSCQSDEYKVDSTLAGILLGSGLVAVLFGVALWLTGPDVSASDDTGSSEDGLTGEAGAGLAPVPSTRRLVEAPR